jgi:hypothetical protein
MVLQELPVEISKAVVEAAALTLQLLVMAGTALLAD